MWFRKITHHHAMLSVWMLVMFQFQHENHKMLLNAQIPMAFAKNKKYVYFAEQ